MRVIFNGDDYGLSAGLNRGVEAGFVRGLLRAASLVPQGEAFGEAVAFLRANPGLDAGVHLTLTQERAMTRAADIFPGLTEDDPLPGLGGLIGRLARGRVNWGALTAELSAQVSAVQSAGIAITHLDGHQYVHLLPGILPVCLGLCKKHGIPFLRADIRDPFLPGAGLGRLAQWAVFRAWTMAYAAPRIPMGVRVVPSVGFTLSGGRLDRNALLKILDRLPPLDAVEVILHPGLPGPEEKSRYGHWGYAWENDTDLVTDPDLPGLLAGRGHRASGFRELLP